MLLQRIDLSYLKRLLLPRGFHSRARLGFLYVVEHERAGRIIGVDKTHNIIPTEGLNHILSVICNAGTQVTTWSVGLFEGNYTPIAADTMATFVASATECTAYDEAARVTWVEAAPSAGTITNAANKAVFTMNAAKNVYGGFLSSGSAKSATIGTLLSAARFTVTPKAVVDDDILRVTASLALTSS